jgi:hypothetical protein
VKIFTLYIEDDRYSVPTLFTVELRDDAEAMAHATGLMAGSSHYQSVDIWDGDRFIGRARRMGDEPVA